MFHYSPSLRSLMLAMALAASSLLFSQATLAEEDAPAEGEEMKQEVQYVPLKPSFVTNYQANKLGYFKTDVTVITRGNATADAISRHLPYIRHNLVMLFSAQNSEALNSFEGKQKLQEDATNQVIAVLNEESESSDVEGVLFTSFIVE